MSNALRDARTASATRPNRLGRERSRAVWGDPRYQAFMLMRIAALTLGRLASVYDPPFGRPN